MPGYLVRHGIVADNTKGVIRNPSSSLVPEGVKQVKKCASILKDKSVTSIRGSDRRYIVQTMNILSSVLHVKAKPSKSLRSLDTGNMVGLPQDKVDPIISKNISSQSENIVADEGESAKEWIKNTWPEVKSFLEDVIEGLNPVIVSHGRVLNLIRAAIIGNGQYLDKKILSDYPTEKHGCVYEVDFDGENFSIKGPIS